MSASNNRKQIEHRLLKVKTSGIPDNSLDRSRLFKSLQVTKSKIKANISANKAIMKDLRTQTKDFQDQLLTVNTELAKLHALDEEIVTEHALLRYVERKMNVDLQKVHDEILELPLDQVYKSGKTFVTVFPDKEDHFNLAQHETI